MQKSYEKCCNWLPVSHATHFKSAQLDLSDTFCSSIVSKITKMFHQFPPTNNRRHYFDWQTNLHLLANVSIGRDSIMLFVMSSCLLIISSCRLCMVLSCLLVMLCFGHILLKKAGLDSGPWTQDLPPKQKNVVKKLLQITLPFHLLKFCRKRNK